ncbi:MAG: hypothetical protein FJ271_25245 [Planctomycetes bacterium]|nr:hypothetical protein [Planctomycetota bacterium]
MAKQKSEGNTSEEIRQALKANRKAKAKEIQAALKEKGVEVTTGQIYFIKGTLKGRKKKAKKVAAEIAAITPSPNSDPLKTILKVKGWANEVGGMKKLKALVDALSE